MKKLFQVLLAGGILSGTLGFHPVKAQQIVYQENFGFPSSTTLVQNFNEWQNDSVRYTGNGTCDIRTSSASSGYPSASAGGNVMINDTVKWFQVSGINTAGLTGLNLYCGLRKTTAEDGSSFVVEASSDSISWQRLPLLDSLPTGTGTSGWHRVHFGNVPACADLHIRFSNLANVDYRLDDLCLRVGEETVLQTVEEPAFAPGGGTYYTPQQVVIQTATADAVIYYTLDGTTPSTRSNVYSAPITVSSTTTIKAVAAKSGMYDSEMATARYVILDTNSLVTLPLDLSGNSESVHADITQMNGFRGYHLGNSYADGSVKFEASNSGKASLVAHLDSAPDSLVYSLGGRKGGSSPSAYEGIAFTVSQSPDGSNWTTVAEHNENDIPTGSLTIFSHRLLSNTRYIRWKLDNAGKGNTLLNDIRITKSDGSAITEYRQAPLCIYPNPSNYSINVHTGRMNVTAIELYNLCGQKVLTAGSTSNPDINIYALPQGTYILKVVTDDGTYQRKVIKY